MGPAEKCLCGTLNFEAVEKEALTERWDLIVRQNTQESGIICRPKL